jgi:hypothetical protein
MRHRMFRATAAVLLAFVLGQLAGGAALAAAGRDPHACDDHACFCRKAAAAAPAAPCHGAGDDGAARAASVADVFAPIDSPPPRSSRLDRA